MWIVITTHANAEDLAIANLERQGFECYCPKVVKKIRHARKERLVKRPFFPGYLFVNMSSGFAGLRTISFSRGVRSIVSFSERPSAVPDGLVDSLKACEKKGELRGPSAKERFKKGQKIRLNGTPFHDFVGHILKVDERERVWILLDLLRGGVRACVPGDAVMPA